MAEKMKHVICTGCPTGALENVLLRNGPSSQNFGEGLK